MTDKVGFYKKVAKVQRELKAPKNQWNKFSEFWYRNLEDILEGLKLVTGDLVVYFNDEIVYVGDRYYIKATATITDGQQELSSSAYAREAESRPKFDVSQLTGSASSYARKMAANALFCIDDTKDADSQKPPKDGDIKLNKDKPGLSPNKFGLVKNYPVYSAFMAGEAGVQDVLEHVKKDYLIGQNNESKLAELLIKKYNEGDRQC